MSGAAAARPTKPRRRRKLAYVLTAVLLGAVVAVLLLEAGFRMFWALPPWFATFQQAGMFEPGIEQPALRAGYRGTMTFEKDYETRNEINSLGMRGGEVPPRAPGQKRVLVIGDSLVFGYGVEADESLPAGLERALRAKGLDVVVGNGGVPGFGSRHYVRHLELLDRRFDADAFVVCGCLGNDAVDDTAPERAVYAGLILQGGMAQLIQQSWRARLMFRSRAALWVENWIYTNEPEWSFATAVSADPKFLARTAGLPPPAGRFACLFCDVVDESRTWQPGTPPVVPRLNGYLRESMQRAQVLAGVRPLLFAMLPTSWHLDPDKWRARLVEGGHDPAGFAFGMQQRRWRQVVEEIGLPVFDATPLLRSAAAEQDVFLSDEAHFNGEGNELLGRWLADELAKSLR